MEYKDDKKLNFSAIILALSVLQKKQLWINEINFFLL